MTLSSMPSSLVAGDSLALSLADMAAAWPTVDGWAAQLVLTPLAGGTPVSVNGTGGVSSWDFALSASVSAGLTATEYRYALLALKTGQRASHSVGTLTVLPDPTGGTDQRSAAERALAVIDAVLEDRAGSADLKFVFEDGRSIERLPHSELLRLRAHYAARVVRERRGRRGPGRVLTRL